MQSIGERRNVAKWTKSATKIFRNFAVRRDFPAGESELECWPHSMIALARPEKRRVRFTTTDLAGAILHRYSPSTIPRLSTNQRGMRPAAPQAAITRHFPAR